MITSTPRLSGNFLMKTALDFLGLIIISLFFASCNPAGQSKGFDYGHIENGIYRNAFFELELTIPEGWAVQSKEQTEEISELGKDLFAGDNKDLKAVLDASDINSANLLAVFKHELGSVPDYNPGIVLVAENLKNAPAIKTGSDYLVQSKKLLLQSQMDFVHMDEEFSREVIGNRDFDIMNCSINYAGFLFHQKYYSTIKNGFCLSLIISYADDVQKSDLEQIVNSLVFNN